jgi:copper chaperone
MTSTDDTATASPGRSATYHVNGMTCGHCVASVTEELEELTGVRDVHVDLVAGGTSTVTVTSDQPLADEAVAAAVAEAGYRLA